MQSNKQPVGQPAIGPNTIVNRQTTTISNSRKTILSVDLGRTSTKACVSRNPNEVIFIASNVAQLTVEKARGGGFESESTDPLVDLWLEYRGDGYALGQLAADFGANLFGGDSSKSPSKVDDALVKVFACAGYFKIKGDVDVILGLPFYSQEQFEQEKDKIISLLMGPHVLQFRGEPISIDIKSVRVMPEGYGSLIWCEAQKTKDTPNFADCNVAIVDVGHQTTDFLAVDSFRFARGVSQSEVFAMSKFYEEVAAKIEGADSQSLYLLEAVHRPAGERFYRPRGSAKPVNLDEIIPELRKKFAQELSSRLVAWLPERVTDVVLTGGGGEFFWEELQPLLKQAQLKAHLAQPARKANALGQFVYGEAQLVKR
ncbi:ParM/StbA family protein [Capilliphycus salinus ALCB114379]|uniref:ParM/StbA family protein n=1 Tax=Capilliphycus salinus TaxID=2768948 RepID=UPI0039A43063